MDVLIWLVYYAALLMTGLRILPAKLELTCITLFVPFLSDYHLYFVYGFI